VGSAFARIGSSSLVLPRKRIIKPFGTFLDPYGHSELTEPRCYRTVPLALLSVGKDGKPTIDNSLILDTREKTIPLDTTKPYKLNANTTGVCMSDFVRVTTLYLTALVRPRALQP
jgi:hypothetical protein